VIDLCKMLTNEIISHIFDIRQFKETREIKEVGRASSRDYFDIL